MKRLEITTREQTEKAKAYFSLIDSSVAFMYEQNAARGSAYLFEGDGGGAFFCYEDGDTLYVYVAFERDTGAYAHEVCALCAEAFGDCREKAAEVWTRPENGKLIGALEARFAFDPQARDMTEFVMQRGDFRRKEDALRLNARGYEEERLEDYLALLTRAMTYHAHPYDYAARREEYRAAFMENDAKGFFRAFYLGESLVGLYLRDWKRGDEVRLLAVAPELQGRGYGAHMLGEAMEELFSGTDAEAMYLYCMDCNAKGQAFYRRFGMRVSGHSKKLSLARGAAGRVMMGLS